MTDNQQKAQARRKRYYERNRDKILAARRDRDKLIRETDPTRLANKAKQHYKSWKANNPDGEKRRRTALQRTSSYVAYRILYGMRKRSADMGWDWDDSWWSKQQIEHIITTQKCAVSGMEFVFAEAANGKSHPFKPTPDRIDNSKGYHPTNVQFVTWMYNLMKSAYTTEDVELFITAVVQHRTESIDQEKVRTEDIVGH
jgi:hypothetical protein